MAVLLAGRHATLIGRGCQPRQDHPFPEGTHLLPEATLILKCEGTRDFLSARRLIMNPTWKCVSCGTTIEAPTSVSIEEMGWTVLRDQPEVESSHPARCPICKRKDSAKT